MWTRSHPGRQALEGLAGFRCNRWDVPSCSLAWDRETCAGAFDVEILPFERALVERWLDEAQGALGEERWTDLLAQGSAMDIAAPWNSWSGINRGATSDENGFAASLVVMNIEFHWEVTCERKI